VFVQGDRLVFDYNCFGEHHVVESDAPAPVGPCELGVRFVREGNEGSALLLIDDQPAGSLHLPLAMRMMSSTGPSIGSDHGSPVSQRYADAFPFEGTVERVDIQLLSRPDADVAAAEARATMARQ
jgi:arylsulfatase